jgi:hypothetical protein
MPVIKRDKSVIVGLNDDLLALANADVQLGNRITVIEGDEDTEGSILYAVKSAKDYAKKLIDDGYGKIGDNENAIALLNADKDTEGSVDYKIEQAKTDVKGYVDTSISTFESDKLNPVKDLVNTINGDSDTDGSFRKAIADVIGSAPEALDTLQEIANALGNDADLKTTLENLIASSVANAKDELKGGASEEYDTFKEIEDAIHNIIDTDGVIDQRVKVVKDDLNALNDAVLKKDDNLASVADKAAARGNLDVYSTSEVDSAIQDAINSVAHGVVTESLTVSDDEIECSNAIDLSKIINFQTVRIPVGPAYYDVTLGAVDDSDVKFKVQGSYDGEFNDASAMIQYII